MLNAISRGFKLWVANLPLLVALVWTVWLPGNLLQVWISYSYDEGIAQQAELRLPMFIEGLFGPLYLAAVIYAIDQRRQGKYVGYFESLGAGLRLWGRLFLARLVTNLFIVLGLLLFVIPGIVFAIRYTLVDMLVVLDDCDGAEARARSWELTQGRSWALFSVVMAFYFLFFVLTAFIYLPIEVLFELSNLTRFQYYALDFIGSCLLDVVPPLLTAVLYCFYLQISGRDYELVDEQQSFSDALYTEAEGPQADAENPYRPPRDE